MYEGYISCSVVMQYLTMPHVRYVYMLLPLVRPHVRHMCVLLPFVMPHVRHARLGLQIAVSLKGRTTRIWSFGFSFAYTSAMGCAGFRESCDTIIFL